MSSDSSRRYLKRVWRVPKDQGPAVYLGKLVLKAMRKHGWPAQLVVFESFDAFEIHHDQLGPEGPADFMRAIGIATRITAARYRVRCDEMGGCVRLLASYEVTRAGQFRELSET